MRDALSTGKVTSVELVKALHDRADEVEPQVNAFTVQLREQALQSAQVADEERGRGVHRGPLHGLPLSVKESFDMLGTPSTMGVTTRKDHRPERDATVVSELKHQGAVILGTTNVPQLLLAMESANELYGTTRNPFNAARVPGGSSGGESAAIASGMSPAGLGTDIGGSIRNPAAWCGIAGLKPTAGVWSMKGSQGAQPGQEAILSQAGPMARTVDDLIFLMEALAPQRLRRWDDDQILLPVRDPSDVDVSGLTIGVYEDDGVFTPADSVRRAVREAADALSKAGARVVTYSPPESWEMVDTYFGLLSSDGFTTALGRLDGDGITQQLRTVAQSARLPGGVRRLAGRALSLAGEHRVARLAGAFGEKSVTRYWQLVSQRNRLMLAEQRAWRRQGLDVVLAPPVVTPAALQEGCHDWSLGAWHTMRYNLLNRPAGVVPVSTVRADEQSRTRLGDRLDRKAASFEAGSAGLPLGVQVIGPKWHEHRVLAVMQAIEWALQGTEGYPKTPVDPMQVV